MNALNFIFRLANEHHSDVSKVQITNQIGTIIASLIPALVLEDSPEGSNGKDEQGDAKKFHPLPK